MTQRDAGVGIIMPHTHTINGKKLSKKRDAVVQSFFVLDNSCRTIPCSVTSQFNAAIIVTKYAVNISKQTTLF